MSHSTSRISVSDYDNLIRSGAFLELGKRVELIRGEIVEMTPAGPWHDDIVVYLNDWSNVHCDKRITVITSQTGLGLPSIDSRPEPDVFWIRRARYRDQHPGADDVQLAIEVADSSLTHDLKTKRLMYAETGIVEYWIVDVRSECVHVFRNPKDGDYREHRVVHAPETLSPLIAPDAVLDLHEMFSGE